MNPYMYDTEEESNEKSFLKIYRNIIEDPCISLSALGFFVIMLSRCGKNDSLGDFRRFTKDNVQIMDAALQELVDNGYACRGLEDTNEGE